MSLIQQTTDVTVKAGKRVGHTSARIVFPYLWHYYTDHYDNRFHHLVVDTFFSIIVMALLAINVSVGFMLYVFYIPPELDVQVRVNDLVITGTPLEATISYNNKHKAIRDVRFEITGPQGWQITEEEKVETIDRIGSNSTGEFTRQALYTGSIDNDYRIIVIYEYYYYGQHYSGVSFVEFKPETTSLEIVPSAPDRILNSEQFDYTVEYTNSSDYPRFNTCLEIRLPAAFFLETSNPTTNDLGGNNRQICFERMDARESGVITLTGRFRNAVGEGKQVITVIATDAITGQTTQTYVQANLQTDIRVLTPRLALTTTGPSVVNVGDTVRYTHRYTNTGDVPLRNVEIVAQLSGTGGGRFSSIAAVDGAISGETATWVDPLLQPGETHTRTIVLQTNREHREKNVGFSMVSQAQADIDDIGESTYVPANEISGKFNSTLDFEVEQRYFGPNGEQLGYGPLPMVADDITALRVLWEIKDFTNDLSNVTIQTTLPSQVEWTGISSVTEGSAISYNPANRTVTWHTSSVPSFSHAQGAQFEVRVSPNFQQVGQQINITNDTKFSARDSHTSSIVTRLVGAIKTSQAIVD